MEKPLTNIFFKPSSFGSLNMQRLASAGLLWTTMITRGTNLLNLRRLMDNLPNSAIRFFELLAECSLSLPLAIQWAHKCIKLQQKVWSSSTEQNIKRICHRSAPRIRTISYYSTKLWYLFHAAVISPFLGVGALYKNSSITTKPPIPVMISVFSQRIGFNQSFLHLPLIIFPLFTIVTQV